MYLLCHPAILAMTLARIPRPQKRRSSTTLRSRVHHHLSLSSLAFWFTFPWNTRCLDRRVNTNANFFFRWSSLNIDVCQISREHHIVIVFSGMLWVHCRILCGLPMSMLGFYKVDPLLFCFCGSSVPSKGIGWSKIPFVLLGLLLQPKTTHLSGIFQIFDLQSEANTVPNKKAIDGLEWRHKLRFTQTLVFWKSAIFPIFKKP